MTSPLRLRLAFEESSHGHCNISVVSVNSSIPLGAEMEVVCAKEYERIREAHLALECKVDRMRRVQELLYKEIEFYHTRESK